MTKAVIDLLNAVFAAESNTLCNLVQHTVPCSEELAKTHLAAAEPDGKGGWKISVFGLINAVLGAMHYPPVAMKVTECEGAADILEGFCEYRQPEPPPVAEVANETPHFAAVGSFTFRQPPGYYWRPCPDITAHELALCMPMLVAGAARLFTELEAFYRLLPTNVQRHWDLVYIPQKEDEKEEKAAEPVVEMLPPVTMPVARTFNIGCFEAEDMFGNRVWGAVGSDNDEFVLSSLRDASGAYVGFSDAYSCLKEWCSDRGIKLKQTTLCVTHDFEKTAGVAIVT